MMKKLLSLFLILALLTGCAMPAATNPSTTGSTPSTPSVPTNASSSGEDGGTLTVHFIDVGQADCALLECEGEYMLIDGGNVADSSLVVSYLEQQGVEELEAVYCSHAHEDHVGGLAGVLAVYPTKAVYAPTRTYVSNCFDDFVYYTDQQGLEITIPSVGDVATLGGATVTVLGPRTSYANTNDTSLVLMVQYGQNRFLFTGDMEQTAEADLLDAGTDLKTDVLKVGHHGSSTSTGYRFLYEAQPAYGIISCGANNSYGHPHEEPLSRLEDADVTVYRTDLMGHIIAVSDGTDITFTWESGIPPIPPKPTDPTVPTLPPNPSLPSGTPSTGPAAFHYIGNRNTSVFHLPTCSTLPAGKNQVLFETYDEAIAAGYRPCSRCLK